ncbi:zinc finger domain-containing protein, partial [bacterium]|nr:zinc finger domain-containing protein [bacterium]
MRPEYGAAIERLKKLIDSGKDPEDVQRGSAHGVGVGGRMDATSGPTLGELLMSASTHDAEYLDLDELDRDLSFILIDRAKIGSDVLSRIHNLQALGGVRMYAEVYKWFTETSGLGLMEEASRLMHPKQASREEEVAEAIEAWLERVNRLERCGSEYHLAESFKKVALKQILSGRIRDNYDLWNSDKLPFDELLRRVRDQARAKKLDHDVAKGKAGVTVGRQQHDGGQQPHGEPGTNDVPQLIQQQRANLGQGEPATDLNAFNKGKFGKGKKGKGKGKGDHKGIGKGDQSQLNAASPAPPPAGGCFICGGKHWARECPKRVHPPQQPVTASVIKLCTVTATASPTEVRNSFQALDPEDEETGGPAELPTPSGGKPAAPPKPGRWRRWSKVTRKKSRQTEVVVDVPTLDDETPTLLVQMSSLIEGTVDSLNGIEEEVEEWEELEFLVDSGAGTTVIGPEDVRAVKASDPDPKRTYKLADGSL